MCTSITTLALGLSCLVLSMPLQAQVRGRVFGSGAPISNSNVTLWAAGSSAPTKLGEARSGADGRFAITPAGARPAGAVLYLIAKGGTPSGQQTDNPAIALIHVLGAEAPAKVTVNEFTTVASVWTGAQFLNGDAMSGHALGLKIAAGNVPNFVDRATGGYGGAIQDALNGGQTSTMANFATLANVLAACVSRVTGDACRMLFAAAAGPVGAAPANTLTAAEAIAANSWYKPERVFGLLEAFYPIRQGKNMRPVPFMPYLRFAPTAWVLPLKFDGGGYRAGGKAMFDRDGNLWVGDNWTVGWQGQDALWQGNVTEFAPNGKPLSPSPTGFTGGGMEGGTFGLAIDANGNGWFANYGNPAIAVFDKHGSPISPPEGITLGGRLGLMQGVIATPSGDIWALGVEKSQLVYFPKSDPTKGRIVCEGDKEEPCRSFKAPFHLAIDQQDRIWVSNSGIDHVTRFPASDPGRVETFKVGYSSSGLNIDSRGNVWVTNRFGSGPTALAHFLDFGVHFKAEGVTAASDYLTRTLSTQKGGPDGGSVNLLRPDGTEYEGSPFHGGGLPAPWAVVVDGNDNVWISNFVSPSSPVVELCGVRTETCPPGMRTGDQISPPNGFSGGGLQMLTDIAIDPAGNVWAMNNWQDIESCVGVPAEALSTLCGGQGVVVFYGMAKPVRSPQIGPARAP